VQTNLVAIRQYLRRHQIPCAVINITRNRKEDADEVYYPNNALELIRLLYKLPFDIVHLHLGGNLTNRLLGLSLACCLRPGARSVLTFHSGGYPGSPEGKSARPSTLRGFVLRRFDRLIGVNQEIVELFHRFGVPASRTRFIAPHAFSSNGENGNGDRLPASIQDFFSRHRPVFSTVGLLEPEYDLQLQIEVMESILKKHPRAGLIIVGAGSLEAELRNLIASKPYAGHILLYGDLDHAYTMQVIARSDVFLRTTHYDGDSVSVREALHFNTPVIASDNGMRPAGVRLIPGRDRAALENEIETCLTQSASRIAIGNVDEQNLEAVLQVYRELM
jgi:glycosyltransferase involved in cell wall biosynthesis